MYDVAVLAFALAVFAVWQYFVAIVFVAPPQGNLRNQNAASTAAASCVLAAPKLASAASEVIDGIPRRGVGPWDQVLLLVSL